MASYLQKLRRQPKQPAVPQAPPVQEPPQISAPNEEASNTSGPKPHPQAAAVTNLSDEPTVDPVLDEEDEKFLARLVAIAQEPEGTPPPLPTRPTEVDNGEGEKLVEKDAQEELMDGSDKTKLPQSPAGEGLGRKKSVLSYFTLPKIKKGEKQKVDTPTSKSNKAVTGKDRTKMADALLAAAESSRSAAESSRPAEMTETEKEQQDLTKILEELNLSAVNNRVFSFSKESEDILNKFTQVLKDIVNGAPMAYNDLEKLFTEYDTQLKKMYENLPPFLQNLVKSLPAKLTATLGPEFAVLQAENDVKQRSADSGKGKRSKIPSIPTIPSLKQLVTAQGAVATALRSILNFLKFRFPALATGTNLLMSLAVFLLLFVFWYCHKRGRETRLEKERIAAESEASAAVSSASSVKGDGDSTFGNKKPVPIEGEPNPPLIVAGAKEGKEKTTGIEDLPSVSHLPDPAENSTGK